MRKTAIINGATGGIGSATAKKLANDYDLILLGRNEDLLTQEMYSIKELTPHCNIDLVIIDCLQINSLNQLNNKLKNSQNVNVFVNSTGIVPVGNIFQVEKKTWKEAFEVGFFATVELVKLISQYMIKDSSIVLINGILAKQPEAKFIVSSAITAALQNFAKAASKDLIKNDIRINSVLPSATNTKLWHYVSKQLNVDNNIFIENLCSDLPLKRLLEPQEVADLITYLCSEKASYINGSSFVIDGGVTSIT